ncbi:hypothetical protein [Methylobacterium sp. A54F]
MLAFDITPDTAAAPDAARRALLRSDLARPDRTHGSAALAAALDDGLLSEEVEQILAGRRMVEAFPVRRGETPPAYAVRAVAEMMVAYLG